MQPDIYIQNIRLAEPVIALTGLFIAAICGYAWWRLRKQNMQSIPQRWMQRFFALMAISSVLGPIFGHLFYYRVGFPGKYASWAFSMLSLAALAQAAIAHSRPLLSKSVFQILSIFNLLAMLLALVISGFQRSFHWVEAHSALALLGFLAPLEIMILKKRKDRGSRLLLWSLPLAVLAVVPHLIKWSPSVWFTYFDIGHVILLGSLWLMLRGAEEMEDVEIA